MWFITTLDKFSSQLLLKCPPLTLDAKPPADQAGFRPCSSMTDYMFTFQQLKQRAAVWHEALWVAVIDLKEAFHRVEHGSVWKAFRWQCVENPYTHLHDQLRATVHTDIKSKQSHLVQDLARHFFTHFSQYIMQRLTEKCNRENHGVRLVDHNREANLSILKFADDIRLISGSLKDTTNILDDFTTATTAKTSHYISTKTRIISHTPKTGK